MSEQKKIVVYSGAGCSACTQVKDFLTQRSLEFEVKDVHNDESAQSDMMEMGFSAIPVTVIGDQPPILGANFQQIESALKS